MISEQTIGQITMLGLDRTAVTDVAQRMNRLEQLGINPIDALEYAFLNLDIGILVGTLLELEPGLKLALGGDEEDDDQ